MAAGSIVIDLLMKTGSFETDTKRAEKRLRELQKSARDVGTAIGVAFAAAATGVALFVKSSIDAADAASKQAAAVGLTTEAYTALAYAADLSGVGQEDFASALTKLARAAKDADDGVKETAKAFADLGVKVRDSDGNLKSTDALLVELAAKFAGLADGTEKTARATEIFGKSGARLLPLLNSGAAGIEEMRREAEALGLVIGGDAARAAEQFNDNLSRLGALARGFGNDLARELLPFLTDTTDLLVQLGKDSRNTESGLSAAAEGAGVLTRALKFLVNEAAFVSFGLKKLGFEMAEFAAKANLVRELAFTAPGDFLQAAGALPGKFRAISEAVDADVARARGSLQSFQDRVANLGTTSKLAGLLGGNSSLLNPPRASVATLGSGGSDKSAAKQKTSDADRYLESLQKQLQATKDLSVAETVLADIQAGRLGTVSNAQRDALVGVAAQIDAAKRLEDQLKAEADQFKQFEAARKALAEEGRAVFEATRSPAEKLAKEIERLNVLLQQGAIDFDTYARAQLDAQEAFDQAAQKIKTAGDELSEFQKNAAENLQRSFGDALVEAMNGNFKSIGDGFKKLIDRMVAEALAAKLVESLFGQGGNGGGALGNILGALGSALGFGGARADGGDVMPRTAYLVGERGPEMFVPRTAGVVLPAAQTAAATQRTGRSVQQVNTFVVHGRIERETQQQLAAMTARQAESAMRRNA